MEQLEGDSGGLIERLLTNAFARAGSQNASAAAASCKAALADGLHIFTALQLVGAINKAQPADSRKLVEIRSFLKEHLLEALQAEVDLLLPSMSRLLPALPKRRVELHISRLDVLQVSKIDQKSQSFEVELFLQGTFINGHHDEALRSGAEAFPVDVCGRPTFRPSAKWFLTQSDFTTAMRPLQTRMSSVVKSGSDLQLNKKIVGEFYNEFDGLLDFPFDAQTLTVTFVINCANEGSTPVDIILDPSKVRPFVVSQEDFADRNEWDIAQDVGLQLITVGASSERRFPALAISVNVRRHPFFYLVNIALPAGLFALLAVIIVLLPVESERIHYLLTLLFTSIAHKLSISENMPTITYFTLLDTYCVTCTMIIMVNSLETAIIGHAEDESKVVIFDQICFALTGVAWLIVNVALAYMVWLKYVRGAQINLGRRAAAPAVQL